MTIRRTSIILIFAAIAISTLAAYYKWRISKQPETPVVIPPVTVPAAEKPRIVGPNGTPHVKGPTAPPY